MHDAVAFTLVEMLAAFAGLTLVAAALGDLRMPHGWTVWGALVVTGVFASALGFLAQTWAQRRATATQTALAYTVEPVWAAFLTVTSARDRRWEGMQDLTPLTPLVMYRESPDCRLFLARAGARTEESGQRRHRR